MATIIKGKHDKAVSALQDALDKYEDKHPGADASLYRQNCASIRLRVIDPRFDGMTKSRRHAYVWEFLAKQVPKDTLSEVSLVLAVTREELGSSFANFEFDHPSRSQL